MCVNDLLRLIGVGTLMFLLKAGVTVSMVVAVTG